MRAVKVLWLPVVGLLLCLSEARAAAENSAPQNPAPVAPNTPGAPVRSQLAAEGDAHENLDDEHGHPATAHARAPKDPKAESTVDYFWRKSDEAFHAGDFERAIGLHKAIVALDPHDSESYGVAAWLMWSLGRGGDAIAHLQRGTKAMPQNSEMWDELGQNLVLQKQFVPAQQAFTEAVKFLPPGSGGMLLRRRLAHAAEKAGDINTALQTWRGLVKDFPTEPVHQNNLQRVEKLAAAVPGLQPANWVLSAVGLGVAIVVPALRTRYRKQA